MKAKKRDFSAIRKTLLDQYRTAQVVKINDDFEINNDGVSDDADEVQQNEFMEVATQLATLSSQKLKNIAAALDRIQNKSYGICETCEQDINMARLEALPFVTRCLKCQSAIDNQ